jgi:hypothetical protein
MIIDIGILTFIGTLKIFRLLKLSKTIILLGKTLQSSLSDLVSFGCMFLIIWLAFVNSMHIYMCNRVYTFRSFLSTMETLFLIILGKFDQSVFFENDMSLAPLFFAFYNVVMVFIVIQIFIIILSDNLTKLRQVEQDKDELTIYEYFKLKSAGFFNLFFDCVIDDHKKAKVYKVPNADTFDMLELKASKLIRKLESDIHKTGVDTDFKLH